MKNKKIVVASGIFLLLTLLLSSSTQKFFFNRHLASLDAPPPPPEWNLRGLDKTYILFEKPDPACLQHYVDKVSNGKADPHLVERIYEATNAYGLDGTLFLGLLYQESGDFIPDRGVNGTGLTQMTQIAIKDTCHALEATDCKKPYANPAYEDIWSEKMNNALAALYDTSSPEAYYPWKRFCAPVSNAARCTESCGITATCVDQIKTAMMKDNRVNLNLGALTLLNFMGVAQKHVVGSLEQKYRYALREYNGHPVNKKTYAQNIFKKLAKISLSCKIRYKK